MKTPRKLLIGLGSVVALLLVIMGMHLIRLDGASFLARSLFETFHVPGFAVIAFGLAFGFSRRMPIRRAYAASFVVSLGLGVFGEFVQIFVQRDASIGDIVRDFVGIIAGLAACAAFMRDDERWGDFSLVRFMPMIAAAALVLAMLPTLWFTTTITLRWIAFPELMTFDRSWETSIRLEWPRAALQVVAAPGNWPLEGNVGLLRFDDTPMPALIFDPYPDWRGYDALTFVAASATGQTESVQLRIHGREYTIENGDRFDRTIEIGTTPERIRIRLEDIRSTLDDSAVDLGKIIAVRIRALEVREGFRIYVDDFRLERD